MQAVVLLISVSLVFFLVGFLWFGARKSERRRVDRFGDRADQSASEIWQEYFKERGVSLGVVEEALRLVEEATGVAGGRLRPDDRFTEELAPEKGWEFDDGLAELRWFLESKKKGASEGIFTLDDFVLALASVEPQITEHSA